MRSIIDFYRSNPLILVVAVVMGLVVTILAASGDSDSVVLEVVAVAAVGLAVGLFIAWRRSQDEEV